MGSLKTTFSLAVTISSIETFIFSFISDIKFWTNSSGAEAPEELVQNFISEIQKDMNVSIEEVVTANEKVVFKLPKELN